MHKSNKRKRIKRIKTKKNGGAVYEFGSRQLTPEERLESLEEARKYMVATREKQRYEQEQKRIADEKRKVEISNSLSPAQSKPFSGLFDRRFKEANTRVLQPSLLKRLTPSLPTFTPTVTVERKTNYWKLMIPIHIQLCEKNKR